MKKTILIFLCRILLQTLIVFSLYSRGAAEEGLKVGHFRFTPAVSLSESYTDNIFLTRDNMHYDLITTFSPRLSIDYAFTPESYLSMQYNGQYRYYKEADNFKNDIHYISLTGSSTTRKGSLFKIGANANFDSIQPYSRIDHHKDFIESQMFSDVMLKLMSFTDVGVRYDYVSRNYVKSQDAINEFDNNSVTLTVIYNGLSSIYPLINYTFSHQDNNDLSGSSTDMDSHIILAGVKWDPEMRLSGYMKAGYYHTKLANGLKSSGTAFDADLAYKLTDLITLKSNAFRRLIRSTAAERETGDFFVSTGGTIAAIYKLREPVTLTANVSYTSNKFHQNEAGTYSGRRDRLLKTGLQLKYEIREWISVMLTYHYSNNDSNIDSETYKENMLEMKMLFAL